MVAFGAFPYVMPIRLLLFSSIAIAISSAGCGQATPAARVADASSQRADGATPAPASSASAAPVAASTGGDASLDAAAASPPAPPSTKLRELMTVARACALRPEHAKQLGRLGKTTFELAHVRRASATTWSVSILSTKRALDLVVDPAAVTCDGTAVDRAKDPTPTASLPDIELEGTFAEGNRCVDAAAKDFPTWIIDAMDPFLIVSDDLAWLEFREVPPNPLLGAPQLDVAQRSQACNWVPRE